MLDKHNSMWRTYHELVHSQPQWIRPRLLHCCWNRIAINWLNQSYLLSKRSHLTRAGLMSHQHHHDDNYTMAWGEYRRDRRRVTTKRRNWWGECVRPIPHRLTYRCLCFQSLSYCRFRRSIVAMIPSAVPIVNECCLGPIAMVWIPPLLPVPVGSMNTGRRERKSKARTKPSEEAVNRRLPWEEEGRDETILEGAPTEEEEDAVRSSGWLCGSINTAPFTLAEFAIRSAPSGYFIIVCCVLTSHNLASPSSLVVTKCRPRSIKLTDVTDREWPVRDAASKPLSQDQIRTFKSKPDVKATVPLGKKRVRWTSPFAPSKDRIIAPEFASHNRIDPFSPPDMPWIPLDDISHEYISPLGWFRHEDRLAWNRVVVCESAWWDKSCIGPRNDMSNTETFSPLVDVSIATDRAAEMREEDGDTSGASDDTFSLASTYISCFSSSFTGP